MGVFFILATKHYIKNGFHLFKFHHFTTPLRVIPCSPLAPSTVCSPGLSLASFQAKANSFCPERETETKICSDAAEQYRHRKALPGQINNNVSETAVSGTSKTTFPHACVPLDLSENLMRGDATTLSLFFISPSSLCYISHHGPFGVGWFFLVTCQPQQSGADYGLRTPDIIFYRGIKELCVKEKIKLLAKSQRKIWRQLERICSKIWNIQILKGY